MILQDGRGARVFGAMAAAFGLVTVGLIAPALGQDIRITTIALSGDVAPGADGFAFERFTTPAVNNACHVAFGGILNTGNRFNDGGFWVGNSRAMDLVAREGDEAPGTSGRTFDFLNPLKAPAFNSADEIAFYAFLDSSDPSTDRTVWVGSLGKMILVAQEGDQPEQVGPSAFALFLSDPNISENGDVTFPAWLDSSASTRGTLWAGRRLDDVALVAREGRPAPDTAHNFKTVTNTPGAYINPLGSVVFRGVLNTSADSDIGLWVGAPDDLRLIVREGDMDLDTGEDFSFINGFSINKQGNVAFFGRTGPIASQVDGIWFADSSQDLSLVVREGDDAPGAPGRSFASLGQWPGLNSHGQVAFSAKLDASDYTNREGLWIGTSPEDLLQVAREGDPAPDTQNEYGPFFGQFVINEFGEVAFQGELGFQGSRGIWSGLPEDLSLVVLESQTIEVAPGDSREILALSVESGGGGISGGEDGRARFFNKFGQVAFRAIFDGSEGVFVASYDPVELIYGLVEVVESLDVNNGTSMPLLSKLFAALHKVKDDNERNDSGAIRNLSDFINIVEKRRGDPIDEVDADELVHEAERISCLLDG